MLERLDCLVIGYNDGDFAEHESHVRTMGERSAEYQIFRRDQILVGGRRRPYLDALSNLWNRTHPQQGSDRLFHIGEVPNLAAVYLTSYLRKHGLSAEHVSVFRPESQRIEAILAQRRPRAVGITTTFYLTPQPVNEIVRFVRTRLPDTTVIVGGPLVNNLVNDFRPDALSYVFEEMGADIYVRESQGEETLGRLLAAQGGGEPLEAVPNVYLRAGGGFSYTGARPERNDLDACAIDWASFDSAEIGVTAQTRTARSCAFKCSFCDYPLRAGALTLASVETVEGELEMLARHGVKNVVFVDDTFNVPMQRFKEICRMMIRRDFGMSWFSYFRCSNARDDETFDLARDSGCRGVFLGIESGDDRILANMNKHASLEMYQRGVERLNERGIASFASFIVGFPGETEETVQSTIDFINKYQPTFYRTQPWWYNTQSPIHARAAEFALEGKRYHWSHDTMDLPGACAAIDEIFRQVHGSVWMPMHNFDFWALPYLLGKGMTLEEIVRFHQIGSRMMAAGDDASGRAEIAAGERALLELVARADLTPPRYRAADATRG